MVYEYKDGKIIYDVIKMVEILFGQRKEQAKFLCFWFLWDSRSWVEHWTKKKSFREDLVLQVLENSGTLVPGMLTSTFESTVNRDINYITIFSSLHVKFGLMKQYGKSTGSASFSLFALPALPYEKITAANS